MGAAGGGEAEGAGVAAGFLRKKLNIGAFLESAIL
jgi:hypothetical protein